MRVEVVHGPNLGRLGSREPDLYGSVTLAEVDASLVALGADLGVEVRAVQSNHEGWIIDHLESVAGTADGVLINPGGLGHTSVVLRDALLGTGLPFVEVHMSNVNAREPFRHRSLLADVAAGTVAGFGVDSYLLGLRGLAAHLKDRSDARTPPTS